MAIAEGLQLVIAVVTIIGFGWTANNKLQQLLQELRTNTNETVDGKKNQTLIAQSLQSSLDKQFIKLQSHNAERYRELYIAIDDFRKHWVIIDAEILGMKRKIQELEAIVHELTNKSQEPSNIRSDDQSITDTDKER